VHAGSIPAVASTTKTLIVKEKRNRSKIVFMSRVLRFVPLFSKVSKTCRHATRLRHGTCFAARIPCGNKAPLH
jgi:hypothetical protein